MKTNEVPEKIYLDSYGSGFSHGFHTNKLNDNDIEYIRKDVLVKYLSEEKGYPITLNGELVHWDELNKHLAEYIKWQKDIFIKKAFEFFDEHLCEYINVKNANCDTFINIDSDKLKEEFKKTI